MLPGMSGIDICRAIRAESGIPIVMLTAKSDTVDVVLGLESGADDYVVKPFKPKELVARMRARLRRGEDVTPELLTIGPPSNQITIDVPAPTVHRAGVDRVVVVWGILRRAWRRSLQLRMVAITLLVSGVLVGIFGAVVASQITAGVVNAKVKTALHQVEDASQRAAPQLGGITDAADTSLPGLVLQVGVTLAPSTSSPDSQVILAILPASPRIPQGAPAVLPPVS